MIGYKIKLMICIVTLFTRNMFFFFCFLVLKYGIFYKCMNKNINLIIPKPENIEYVEMFT